MSESKEGTLSLEEILKLLEKYGEIELNNVTIHIDKLLIRSEKASGKER
ncbi:MAG: hypothetical protein QXV60_00575 [Nitrososphaerota archaeon]